MELEKKSFILRRGMRRLGCVGLLVNLAYVYSQAGKRERQSEEEVPFNCAR